MKLSQTTIIGLTALGAVGSGGISYVVEDSVATALQRNKRIISGVAALGGGVLTYVILTEVVGRV